MPRAASLAFAVVFAILLASAGTVRAHFLLPGAAEVGADDGGTTARPLVGSRGVALTGRF